MSDNDDGHIHPDVRSIVSKKASGVQSFEPYEGHGAKLVAKRLIFSGVKELNAAGYTVGGMFSHGDYVKIYVVPDWT